MNDNIHNNSASQAQMMDDLQFRRSILADPSSQDEAILAAKSADPAKKKLADDLCQFDEKLKQAMKITVPEDLADKLLLRQSLASHQQEKRKTRTHLALAASVAIIAGIVVNYLQFSNIYSNLGDYALAHVYHEQAVFSNDDNTRVSLSSLNKKMSTFKGSFNSSMGELISADYCRFDGIKSLHLVFKGEHSPVTVFVIPHDKNLSVAHDFFDDKFLFRDRAQWTRGSWVN